MSIVNITLPDSSVKTFKGPISAKQVADSIGPGLARVALVAKINDELKDLSSLITDDSYLEFLKGDSDQGHNTLLHSAAHLMAQAVKYYWPNAKLTIGPAIENRFYYDFDIEDPFTEKDLLKIEKKMHEYSKKDYPCIRCEVTRDEAIEIFSKMNESYKLEILEDIDSDQMLTSYSQGSFVDLCRGPHVPSTGKIKYFKLLSSSGAYWRGDENNKMLQRIYGTAFHSKAALKDYLMLMEEAKKRDHRKLGKDLKIFIFNEEIGPGLPLWLPNGTVMIEELEKLAKESEKLLGYQSVRTPHIAKGTIYNKTGHLPYYQDSMYPAMNIDGIEYYIKPMNCPHHHKIYDAYPRSYKELPVRFSEYGACYRYEKSGQLFGLMRVRSLQMNDAHIYCTRDQFKREFMSVCKLYLDYFKIFGIKKYSMRLSLHDKQGLGKKYVDEPTLWLETEKWVREAMIEGGIDFEEVNGEAAFYGPKIDVQVWSAIGKEFTLATNQVDFAIPNRLNLVYKDKDGSEKTPLCIHRAPLGTHERFIGFLIEHFGGNFPLWLAPIQVNVIPVSDKNLSYAFKINNTLISEGIRSVINEKSDKIGAKIRHAELEKNNVMLIVGDKEESNKTVSYRRRFDGDMGIRNFQELKNELLNEIKTRSLSHS